MLLAKIRTCSALKQSLEVLRLKYLNFCVSSFTLKNLNAIVSKAWLLIGSGQSVLGIGGSLFSSSSVVTSVFFLEGFRISSSFSQFISALSTSSFVYLLRDSGFLISCLVRLVFPSLFKAISSIN